MKVKKLLWGIVLLAVLVLLAVVFCGDKNENNGKNIIF